MKVIMVRVDGEGKLYTATAVGTLKDTGMVQLQPPGVANAEGELVTVVRKQDCFEFNAELQDMVNTLEERATTARVAAEQHIGVYGEEATFEDDTQDSDEGVEVVH